MEIMIQYFTVGGQETQTDTVIIDLDVCDMFCH